MNSSSCKMKTSLKKKEIKEKEKRKIDFYIFQLRKPN